MEHLHKLMFKDVWRWAGSFRRVDTTPAVEWQMVAQQVGSFCYQLKYQVEAGAYPRDELAIRFHHGLVSIHPFSNGNGRHSRLAGDLLVQRVGGERFTWGGGVSSKTSATRDKYIPALKIADQALEFSDLVSFARS